MAPSKHYISPYLSSLLLYLHLSLKARNGPPRVPLGYVAALGRATVVPRPTSDTSARTGTLDAARSPDVVVEQRHATAGVAAGRQPSGLGSGLGEQHTAARS